MGKSHLASMVRIHHPRLDNQLTINIRRISYMFKVLNNDTAVAVTETLNEAITIVRSLEAGLDRLTQHSPYTIVKA